MADNAKKNRSDVTTTKNANEIFFEKFSNTKQEFKKSKIKKSKFYQFFNFKKIDIHLENNAFVKWSYLIFVLFLIIATTFSALVIVFFNDYFLKGTTASIAQTFLGDLNNIIHLKLVEDNLGALLDTNFIFACLSISFLFSPYLYLISTWFIGFNNVYRSKVFFICNVVIIMLVLTFVLLMIIFTAILLTSDFIDLPPFKPVA